jgi:hypothetical protein
MEYDFDFRNLTKEQREEILRDDDKWADFMNQYFL